MLSGGNQTDGNTLERFLTPYQYSTLPPHWNKCIISHSNGIIVKATHPSQLPQSSNFRFTVIKFLAESLKFLFPTRISTAL